ncbi:monovalent cation/H+ antiporter subunit D [Pistricoccus aurantiacus]|uniref:monovalent cation/H+ antiporter subunit D n=1 Tax=Pistricoccus aurantiacus TaxID=1883414 RepID=UPI0036265D28
MMQHLIILPVVLPLATGAMLLLNRQRNTRIRRNVGLLATALLVVIAIALVAKAASGEVDYYALGDWQPPFGIILVLDRLSALMVLLTSLLALACVIFASAGEDDQGSNFHGLFQLQLMGINGAFLTGDLFNLFVFFEVLLLASYALLVHGGGKPRIQASVHYVVLNLANSSLFLIAVGVLYGATGTLNMADMAMRIGAIEPERTGLVSAAALLLLVVFGVKAAILPLYFWLPRAYAAAPAPVAALFAIMTKVGVYAILRVYHLIFGEQAGPLAALEQPWVWWLSLATLAAAAIGVLAARDLRLMVSYLILVSVGTLLAGIGIRSPESVSALLYYLIHTTLVTGGLFLLAEMIGQERGKAGTRLVKGKPLRHANLLGLLFFLGAITVAGIPPLSGALGKVLLLSSTPEALRFWFWPILLSSGLCALIALSRAGSTLFWRSNEGETQDIVLSRRQLIGVSMLLGASPVIVALSGPIHAYTTATAEQLAQPRILIEAILIDSGEKP